MPEHQVWSIPPGQERSRLMGSFDLDRWQWAEKFAQSLRERDHTQVEVLLVDTEAESDG